MRKLTTLILSFLVAQSVAFAEGGMRIVDDNGADLGTAANPLIVEGLDTNVDSSITFNTNGQIIDGTTYADILGFRGMTNPAIALVSDTSGDTNYYITNNSDNDGVDDDLFQIGAGTLVGTTPWLSIDPNGSVLFNGPRIWYLSTSDDIESFITNTATAGDTIVLGPGTWTITDDIDIGKAVTIIGSGRTSTIIACSTAAKNLIDITVSSVRIYNLGVSNTGAGASIGIRVFTANLTGIVLSNISFTMNGTGDQRAVDLQNSGADLYNPVFNVTSSNNVAYGLLLTNNSSAGSTKTANLYSPVAAISGGSTIASCFRASEATASNDAIVNVYNPSCTVVEGAATSSSGASAGGGANGIVNVYGGSLSATDADVAQASSAVLNIYGTTLVNGTISGTITYLGTQALNNIAAAGTITSSATGTLGWSIVAGADTDCTTTCTSACAMGFATDALGGSNPVACADATADNCLCAGGS